MKQRTLANLLNIHPVYLNAILKKRRKPSIELAVKIQLISNGEYKAEDFCPEIKELKKLL